MDRKTLNINEILPSMVTCIDFNFVPPGFRGDAVALRLTQLKLAEIVNTLGEESTQAQGLRKTLTTSDKLRSSDHVLYLLKDEKGDQEKGELIGLLKVGRKRMYFIDNNNKHWEGEPWCVLDFFIKPKNQKQGNGKILFDYMLQDIGVSPYQLAIDGPSVKMYQFMAKTYGVDKLIRQNNNFAVSKEFFEVVSEERNKSGQSTPHRVPSPVFGRYGAYQPPCSIGTIIHGSSSTSQDTARLSRLPSKITTPVMDEANSYGNELTVPDNAQMCTQKTPERPSTLRVEPITKSTSPKRSSPAGSVSPRRESQLTDRGFFDLKYYHNKLW